MILAAAARGPAEQIWLRRAVSSAYYALFHGLAKSCADILVGAGEIEANTRAWAITYRALDHGAARTACRNVTEDTFPKGILDFARNFIALQEQRHAADYDPRLQLTRAIVDVEIDRARTVLIGLEDLSPADRRAFAAHVLFRRRTA